MNKLDKITTLLVNETRLEERAIKSLAQSEVIKKAKREIQRALVKDILIQSTWCELIVENDNKQALNQNRDINSRNKIKSGNNKRRRLNNNNNNVQFENSSSEIIDDEIVILKPLNYTPYALENAVAR